MKNYSVARLFCLHHSFNSSVSGAATPLSRSGIHFTATISSVNSTRVALCHRYFVPSKITFGIWIGCSTRSKIRGGGGSFCLWRLHPTASHFWPLRLPLLKIQVHCIFLHGCEKIFHLLALAINLGCGLHNVAAILTAAGEAFDDLAHLLESWV